MMIPSFKPGRLRERQCIALVGSGEEQSVGSAVIHEPRV